MQRFLFPLACWWTPIISILRRFYSFYQLLDARGDNERSALRKRNKSWKRKADQKSISASILSAVLSIIIIRLIETSRQKWIACKPAACYITACMGGLIWSAVLFIWNLLLMGRIWWREKRRRVTNTQCGCKDKWNISDVFCHKDSMWVDTAYNYRSIEDEYIVIFFQKWVVITWTASSQHDVHHCSTTTMEWQTFQRIQYKRNIYIAIPLQNE